MLVVALHVQPSPSRLMLLYFAIVNVIIMSVMRAIAKAAARALLAGERLGASIVMVVEQGQRERIERVFDTGATYSIAGWLELADGRVSGTVADKDVTSEIEALPEALGDTRVDDVFVFAPRAGDLCPPGCGGAYGVQLPRCSRPSGPEPPGRLPGPLWRLPNRELFRPRQQVLPGLP